MTKIILKDYINKFIVNPGVIDLSKTIIEDKDSSIKAGTKLAVSIEVYDKYGNSFSTYDYLTKFTFTFIDAINKKNSSKGVYDEIFKKVYYTSETSVTIAEKVKVEVVYIT